MSSTDANRPAHPLDNPIWSALTTAMASLAQGTERAKHFGRMAATVDHSEVAYADLRTLIAPGSRLIMIEPDPPSAIDGLAIEQGEPLLQMVIDAPMVEPDGSAVVALTLADASDIAALVALTDLRFAPDLLTRGQFFGVRVDGRLVSVSGQRVTMTGYREISTVVTHPDFLGRGYAAQVVTRTANRIFAEGKTPFLYVDESNNRARRLYERLGFRVRRPMSIFAVGR